MVIRVEAGAVAEPMAPSSREKDKDKWKNTIMDTVIRAAATRASNMVMTITFFPFFFNLESLKNFPTPKAIKARAISVTNSMDWGSEAGVILKT